MLDKKLLIELKDYVQNHIPFVLKEYSIVLNSEKQQDLLEMETEIETFIKNKRKPTLNQILFRFIDKKAVSDSNIYKKAGIDRRHFSKIRSNPNYRIGKNTALALALALELNFDETDELLGAAGYSLSESDTHDLIIQFFMDKKIYDIDQVNQALDYFNLKPLTD